MHYQGLLYRALNPVWAADPLSGEGARRYGGRFNPKGMAALYTASSIMTALREANQIGTLQPTTLVAYEADLTPIFDATDAAALAGYGISPSALAADDWRSQMLDRGLSPTQSLARQLEAAGYLGLWVPSYAKGAGSQDRNLVLWHWRATLPARLILVDDEGRLQSAPPLGAPKRMP